MPTNFAPFSYDDLLLKILTNLDHHREITRLFHGRGGAYLGLEHLVIDYYPPFLYIRFFKEDNALEQFLRSNLRENQNVKSVFHFRYNNSFEYINCDESQASGFICNELGLKYKIKIGRSQNIGFFPDMRDGKKWLFENAYELKGKKALNLFSYTCSVSVVLKAIGMDEVYNVDLGSNFLSWGRENHLLNFDGCDGIFFQKKDILKSLSSIAKKGPFDLVFYDPPSLQKGSFDYKKDYEKVLRRMDKLLAPKGYLVSCLNTPFETSEYIKSIVEKNCPGLEFIKVIYSPEDFVEIDKESGVKICIFKRKE